MIKRFALIHRSKFVKHWAKDRNKDLEPREEDFGCGWFFFDDELNVLNKNFDETSE